MACIGIIGAGALGSNIARLLAKGGISAMIANKRGPESLAKLIAELGLRSKREPLRKLQAPMLFSWRYAGSISKKR